MKEVVLEPSTNSHVLRADKVQVTNYEPSIMGLDIQGKGVLVHGEHGTFRTNSTFVLKYVQQEQNPITGDLQNSWD